MLRRWAIHRWLCTETLFSFTNLSGTEEADYNVRLNWRNQLAKPCDFTRHALFLRLLKVGERYRDLLL